MELEQELNNLPPTDFDRATDKQKSAILGLVYHRSPNISVSSKLDEVVTEIEHLTGVTVKWDNLDKKLASKIIGTLITKQ